MRRPLRVAVTARSHRAVVVLRRRFFWDSYSDIHVTAIDLGADDVDERLAEARAKAKDMARQLNGLERP